MIAVTVKACHAVVINWEVVPGRPTVVVVVEEFNSYPAKWFLVD